MKSKINVFDIIYIFVLFYAFSTLTQSLYSFSLNRIWTFGIIACMLCKLFRHAYKSTIICFGILLVVCICTMLNAKNVGRNINDYIYFITTVLWFLFMMNNKNRQSFFGAAIRNEKLTNIILIVSYAFILFPLLTKNGFEYSWGSTPYFIGFAGTPHAMASSMCLISAVFLLFSLRKKFSWMNLAILMFGVYVVLETGARTFIVPITILVIYYVKKDIKKINIKSIVYVLGALAAIYMVQNSSMLNKFKFVLSGENMAVNAIDGFTSGRSIFWLVDLEAFTRGNVLQVLLGRGFDYVYQLNKIMVNQEIWVHNDFIHLLLGGGILAFIVYIYSVFKFLKEITVKQGKFDKLMIVTYLLFPAMVNGFFMYQHLLLSMMIFSSCFIRFEEELTALDSE